MNFSVFVKSNRIVKYITYCLVFESSANLLGFLHAVCKAVF